MNLIDAIKSGRPFRVSSLGSWMIYSPAHNKVYLTSSGHEVQFSVESVLLDTWEVEEKKMELTAKQIKDAYEKARNDAILAEQKRLPYKPEICSMLSQLGFDTP